MKIPKWAIAWIFLAIASHVYGQQITDESFRWEIQSPSFESGDGPVICIDESHNNFHTINGTYKAFTNLIRSDGYTAIGFGEEFSVNEFSNCDLLVIANARDTGSESGWSYPHNSAFTGGELTELVNWIDQGGNLLLIADHAPAAGAASGLGAVLGLVMTDVYAVGNPSGNDIFSKSNNTLHEHSILSGTDSTEEIESIMTFTGQPVQITEAWDPLISFGPEAIAIISPQQMVQLSENRPQPRFSIAGWIHGAARELGTGRIVFLGEASMCTAQLAGPNQLKAGMNNPEASQNAQFCLNVVHWLTRVMD